MSRSPQKLLFTLAAVFNWAVGLALFFNAALLFEFFYVTPLPAETLFLRLFAGLVFVFGFGYYAAGNDLKTNAPVIRLGTIGKLVVFAVAAGEVVLGNVSWQFLLLASVDLVFAVLFFRQLRKLGPAS
jgi:hypothetical protein